MRIEALSTHLVRLPFGSPVSSAQHAYGDRLLLLVEVKGNDGELGWGECSALEAGSYFWEDIATARSAIEGPIRERLLGIEVESISSIDVEGAGPMSIAAVEMALLDAELKALNLSLRERLGLGRERVGVAATLGMPESVGIEKVIEAAGAKVAAGARTLKLKISPTSGFEVVSHLRKHHPPEELTIIADANESFENEDSRMLFDLAERGVLIEQPLARNDFQGHAQLVAEGLTGICLDESIESLDDVRRAHDLNAAQAVVLKPGRLGGIAATRAIQKWCRDNGMKTRIGGMFSAALGNHVERALSLDTDLPGDIAPLGERFAGEDLTFTRDEVINGTVSVWDAPGVGPAPEPELLRKFG